MLALSRSTFGLSMIKPIKIPIRAFFFSFCPLLIAFVCRGGLIVYHASGQTGAGDCLTAECRATAHQQMVFFTHSFVDYRLIKSMFQLGQDSSKVLYRGNRLVLFPSSLLHKSDSIHFKPGYANRRISVTMVPFAIDCSLCSPSIYAYF
jgi:hypothetical protein